MVIYNVFICYLDFFLVKFSVPLTSLLKRGKRIKPSPSSMQPKRKKKFEDIHQQLVKTKGSCGDYKTYA